MTGLQWLSPWSLLALLPLAGLIVLLYLLRLRRREVRVASTYLWRQAMQDVQANVPFQRLKRNLLLLLQLLAMALLVLALASPYLWSRHVGGRSVVVVLDASASMKATDVPGSRFEEARQQALEMARGLRRRDEMAVVVCGARPTVELPFTSDQREIQVVLQKVQPADCSTHVQEGLLLALSLAARRPEAMVCLYSDGAFPELPPIKSSAQIRFICLGQRSENLAILACDVTRQPNRTGHQIFLRVRNFGTLAQAAIISLHSDDQLLQVEKLTLQAGESRVLTYSAKLPHPGLLRAELDVADDLAADNVAYAAPETAGETSVLLVSPGNLFLEQGLLVLPEVSLFQAATLSPADLVTATQRYDVVVLDRVPLSALPPGGGVLLIGALGAGAPATSTAHLTGPVISRWDKAHPVLTHVDLSPVQIAKAPVLQPVAGALSLAMAGDAPLLVTRETAATRVLLCGFNFLDTDWPLRVSFPVFLSNAVHWLAEAGSRTRLVITRPGEVLRAPVRPELTQVELIAPDGARRVVPVSGGALSFAGADQVGVYHLQLGAMQRRWAMDLRDPMESDLTPRRELKLGSQQVVAGVTEPRREAHLWPWLVLMALALLLAEWHVYHRRY